MCRLGLFGGWLAVGMAGWVRVLAVVAVRAGCVLGLGWAPCSGGYRSVPVLDPPLFWLGVFFSVLLCVLSASVSLVEGASPEGVRVAGLMFLFFVLRAGCFRAPGAPGLMDWVCVTLGWEVYNRTCASHGNNSIA